jgi:hypothetical protein
VVIFVFEKLSSCVAALSSLLLPGMWCRCQFLWSLLFSLISVGQLFALGVAVCSGVAFQPAHCIVSLKNLTAASVSFSVLRGTCRVNLLLTRSLK